MEPKEVTFGAGQTLFRQGDKGGELYFIKEGQVELSVRHEETGAEAVVAVVGERSVLGTMTFLEGEPRSATAKALDTVKCVIVNQIQRERLLNQVPVWFRVLLKDLSGNLRRLNLEFTKLRKDHEDLEKRYKVLQSKVDASAAKE